MQEPDNICFMTIIAMHGVPYGRNETVTEVP